MKLPHRFPFLLVDRETGDSGVVRASVAAWWGRGPRVLTLPLLVEAVAQSAALVLGPDGASGERLALAAVESAQLERLPDAGDSVEIRVRLEARFGRLVRVRGELSCDGKPIGGATVVLAAG